MVFIWYSCENDKQYIIYCGIYTHIPDIWITFAITRLPFWLYVNHIKYVPICVEWAQNASSGVISARYSHHIVYDISARRLSFPLIFNLFYAIRGKNEFVCFFDSAGKVLLTKIYFLSEFCSIKSFRLDCPPVRGRSRHENNYYRDAIHHYSCKSIPQLFRHIAAIQHMFGQPGLMLICLATIIASE